MSVECLLTLCCSSGGWCPGGNDHVCCTGSNWFDPYTKREENETEAEETDQRKWDSSGIIHGDWVKDKRDNRDMSVEHGEETDGNRDF